MLAGWLCLLASRAQQSQLFFSLLWVATKAAREHGFLLSARAQNKKKFRPGLAGFAGGSLAMDGETSL